MKLVGLFIIALVSSQHVFAWQLWSQCDPKWGQDSIGSRTICAIGCLMSSVAMALATFKKPCGENPCTPKALNKWLKANGGYQGNLFVWQAVGKLGLQFENWTRDKSAMKNAFKAGKVVILNVHGGRHWVLMTGQTNGGFKVNDPGYDKNSYPDSEVVDSGVFKKKFLNVFDLLTTLQFLV